MNRDHLTEVYVLCGFLGSGKSTLLTRLIQYERQRGRSIAVIMNELGEVSIDSSFVPQDMPLMELTEGCICCSLQGDLGIQLEQLLNNYHLDAIYIESTGAAQPFDLLDASTDPIVASLIEVRAVITVVDARLWAQLDTWTEDVQTLVKLQVKHADMIVLNKIDTLPVTSALPDINIQIDRLIDSIQQSNPRCRILPVSQSNIDLSMIQTVDRPERKAEDPQELRAHHPLHLSSITIKLNSPLDRHTFSKWLTRYSTYLYRAKGYIQLKDEPGLFLFQYANEQIIFTRFLLEQPYEPVLVLIGEKLPQDQMREELHQLQAASHALPFIP